MVLKIRELINALPDKGGVVYENGREIVQAALVFQLATGKIEGGLAFIGIYNGLREKGFPQNQAIEGALDGAEHVARLEAASRGAGRLPEAVNTLVADYMTKTGSPAHDHHAHPAIISEADLIRGIATEAAAQALAKAQPPAPPPAPPKPTFEDSLNEHQRKCMVCREIKLREWNAKQGVK